MQRIWRIWLFAIALALGLGFGTARAQDEEKPAATVLPPVATILPQDKDKGADPAKTAVVIENNSTPLSGWYVQVDALIMRRTQTNMTALNAVAPILSNNLRYNYDGGPKILFGYELNRENAIEFSWFGLFNMHAGGNSGPGLLTVVDNRSRMQNVEANFRHWITNDISTIMGLRYVNWHETYRDTLVIGGVPNQSRILTNNNLFGVQVGVDWFRSVGKRSIMQLYGRAGFFGNEALGRYSGFGVSSSDCISRPSMVAELGIVTTIKITDRFSLRSGITGMAISQIAQAPDQYSNLPPFSGSLVNAHGSVFLGGAVIGGEFRW